MWEVVMGGLGIVVFLLCLAYIEFCERLREAPDPATAAVKVEEDRS